MTENYIRQLISKDIRVDGRGLTQYREIKIERSISPKSAEGSARVIIGDTEVVAGVKMDIGNPFPDTPDEGVMIVNTELLPLSSPEFESGPPSVQSIELSRVIDRGIRESKSLDTKKLCIKAGEKVWMIFIDIYPINEGGNLFDAAGLAAVAALQDAKFPVYDEKNEKIDYNKKKTDKGLPLGELPVSCTVWQIQDKIIIDPTSDEEKAMEARLTVASFKDGTICAMQKGGTKALSSGEINKVVEIALEKANELRKVL